MFEDDKISVPSQFKAVSGVYNCVIKALYLQQSQSSPSKELKMELAATNSNGDTGRVFLTFGWILGKTGAVNQYAAKAFKEMVYFLTGDTNVESMLQQTEPKTIKQFQNQIQVESLPFFTDKEIKVGLIRKTVNKTSYDKASQKQITLPETRDEWAMDKFFDVDSDQTPKEKSESIPASFIDSWLEAHDGKVHDYSKKVSAPVQPATVNNAPPASDANKPAWLMQ